MPNKTKVVAKNATTKKCIIKQETQPLQDHESKRLEVFEGAVAAAATEVE